MNETPHISDPGDRRLGVDKSDQQLAASLRRLARAAPDPALRRRTLDDVRAVLASHDLRRTRSLRRPVLVAALLLLCVWALPRLISVPDVQPLTADRASIVEWLDLDPDLARHVRARLNSHRLRSHRPNSRQDRRLARGQEALGLANL